MLGLVFYFEDHIKNIYSGSHDGDIEIWRSLAKCFEYTWLAVVDVSTGQLCRRHYKHTDAGIGFQCASSLEELEEQHLDANWVYLEHGRVLDSLSISYQPLRDLTHPPEPVIYVVGPDSGSIVLPRGREDKTWCSVESISPSSMWSPTAAAIVLYDRHIKS
jgi:hypothetical protein